jgi:hypothetical protein
MRYVIVVSVEDAEQSCELAGLPLVPDLGDTVQLASRGGPIVGVVKERHYAYQAPDLCQVTLACKRL